MNADPVAEVIERYATTFGRYPEIAVSAPGRVNLIGEHTDYNEGYVLPMAIDRAIAIAGSRRDDESLVLNSVDIGGTLRIHLSEVHHRSTQTWANYPIGVAHVLRNAGYRIGGGEYCIKGTVPVGAGLSSSAALEVASTIIFALLHQLTIPVVDMIHLARKAEVEFVGVQCGIMDQFVSMMGERGSVLFLDCRTLAHSIVACPDHVRILVCDTGIKRELARSAYNERRKECGEIVAWFSGREQGVASLRDVTPSMLERCRDMLPPLLLKRAMHVVSENERVRAAVRLLERNDTQAFGRLMTESHVSLRDQYEVSCRELDTVVDLALSSGLVYGARMTGAGFGGCAICLLEADHVSACSAYLAEGYKRRIGRELMIYPTIPSDGARVFRPDQPAVAVRVAGPDR